MNPQNSPDPDQDKTVSDALPPDQPDQKGDTSAFGPENSPEKADDLSSSEEKNEPVNVIDNEDAESKMAPVASENETPAQQPASPIWPHESFTGGAGQSSDDDDSFSPPAPRPGEDVAAVPPAAPVRSGKKKLSLLAIIVGIIVLVLGASAAAYFAYYLPNQPENILKSALANSFAKDKVTSVHFNGEINTKDADNQGLSVGFKGATGQQGQLDMTAEIDAMLTTIAVDVRSLDGKTLYAKVGGLEGLPELLGATDGPAAAGYASLLATIDDQWYEINQSLLKEVLGTSFDGGLLTNEDRQKLAQAYDKHPFLKVQETYADEKINGHDSYHYKVAIDNDALKSFVKDLKDAKLSLFTLNQAVVDGINDTIDQTDFSKYPVEVWIAKDSKMFTQFKQTVQQGDTTTDIRLTITDYNKTFTVEKPEDAKSILEIVGPFMQSAQESLESLNPTIIEELETNGGAGDVTL